MKNHFKPQRTEGVQPLSAIDSKNNKKFSKSDWAHNAENWLTRQEGWEDSKPSSQQAIGVHILRVEKLSHQSTEGLTDSEKEKVEVRNNRNKERLKKAVIDRILAGSEEALESDSTALRTIYGHDLPDDKLVESYLSNQREKLGVWIDYLDGETDAKLYPTWFKIYVMDGVENMGRYNAEKGIYEKRSNGTIAEYPDLNPAALAKTFDVVNDFYVKNNKPKEEKELELFNSGSFNRIYSKIKSETTFNVKIPEWFGDIKGTWKEYNPGMTKELMAASQGTPWCIQGSNMANQYLNFRGGKFYLLHLEDPETGALSETAAASIRMEGGEVAEISGVRDDSSQKIDISLLPSMIEKLEQLPGGEKFQNGLSRSLELIENFPEKARMDGLKYALGKVCNSVDGKIHFDESDIIINNLEELKKDFTLDEIFTDVRIKTLEPYIKAGFTTEEVFEKINTYGIDGYRSFVEAGIDKLRALEKIDDINPYEIEYFIEQGFSMEKVLERVSIFGPVTFKFYIEQDLPAEKVFERVQAVGSPEELKYYVEQGIPPEKVFEKVDFAVLRYFEDYVEQGIPPEKVFDKIDYVNKEDYQFYVDMGISPEKVFEKVHMQKYFRKIGHALLKVYGKLNRFL